MPFAILTYWNDLVDQLRELVDAPLSSDPFMQYGMNILNGTECADVNGECRYVREMNVNHFFTIAGVFFVIYLLFVIYLYCSLGSKLNHYKKLPRGSIDIGRYRLSKQMEKSASESRQRMKDMTPKPVEAADKTFGVICTEWQRLFRCSEREHQ